jgi:DNA-binding protein HU-beta
MPFFIRSGSKKETIKHKEFIKMYAQKASVSEEEAAKQISYFIETLFDGIKEHRPITIEHLGNFHVAEHKDSVAFRFNPAQKLKAILGWSSTYNGNL